MLKALKKLKLYQQLIVIVILAMGVVLGAILVTTEYFIKDYSHQLTVNLEEEVHLTLINLIKNDKDRLASLIQSHSFWTELVEAASQGDREWISVNATQYLLEDSAYGVSEIYLSHTGSGYTEQHGVLSESLYRELFRASDPEQLRMKASTYLAYANDSLYILSISGLTDSDHTQLEGFMVLGTRADLSMTKALNEAYGSKATIEMTLVNPSSEPLISIDVDSLMPVVHDHFNLKMTQIQLVSSVVNQANRLLTLILSILFVSSLLFLGALLKLTGNFETSIQSIKNITYHDYTQKIHLDFSKDFVELSECINNLSDELSLRDRHINLRVIEIISILVKTLEEVDHYTKGHSERVSHYSVALARAIDYPDLETIRLSGLLHDIGKVTVDINILNKPGRLTPEEFEEIKRHPSTAYNILAASDVFLPIRDIVKHHHERIDGSGYPDQLTSDTIPLGAKIVAISDVFDSLTSERSYRQPMSVDEALKVIVEGSGSHFDPDLVQVFVKIAQSLYDSWSGLQEAPRLDELYTEPT